ncbi:MAG: alpha-L-fucosidase [Eubacteriales bacterium]
MSSRDAATGLLVPSSQQREWADQELGVIIHFDIPVFQPDFFFRDHMGEHLDASIFNPTQLDTDQWVRTAHEAGAKYAVLVAKHCSGFSLWPTDAHGYSVKSTPWRDGQGDIVGDFVKSCQKFGLKPGLYYSISANGYFNVDNPGKVLSGDADEQKRYNEMVVQQVTELWTRYGELFEIWFDGGALPPEQGGPDVLSLLLKHQPNAVCFQGPEQFPSVLRWVGNEDGNAPDPCWSTTNVTCGDFDGTMQFAQLGVGDPDGCIWSPAETDMPNRKVQAYLGGWFWCEGEDDLLYSVDELVERYYTSVGSNTNLLIGMAINTQGLVPDADVKQFQGFGQAIRERFASPIGQTQGDGESLTLMLDAPEQVDSVVLMERIEYGERVREYRVEGLYNGVWQTLARGQSIGHKRIVRFDKATVEGLRLTAEKSVAEPKIRLFAAYLV